MDLTYPRERPRIVQQWFQFGVLVVPNQATRLSNTLDDTQLITEFYVSNPTQTAPGFSAFLGSGPNVAISGQHVGLEIPPGQTRHFHKQLFETQIIQSSALGRTDQGVGLIQPPVVIFDLTQLWIISNTGVIDAVCITAFPQVYL